MLTRGFTEYGMCPMPAGNAKQQAHELIDQLPDSATWDEIAYRAEVHASIQRGLADSEAGRTISQEEVEKRFGVKR
jgi:predicted transcriptional regulator